MVKYIKKLLRLHIDTTKIWHPKLSIILTDQIGENCIIHTPVWIGKNVKIGNNVKIQAFAFIPDGVTIEDNVFIGPHVCFTNDKHPPSNGLYWAETLVKRGAVIGAGAVILPGLTIGEDSIIGAGAIITKDVPADEVWISSAAQKYEM